MSRIQERFSTGKLLIPYIMGGWPDIPTSAAVLKTFVKLGCPIVEVGIPYSDPLADGPTIQRASEAALAHGINTDQVFEMIAGVTTEVDVSPILMVYYNLIYRYGIEKFARSARQAGVDGIIVPDLTVEESSEWLSTAKSENIDTIFLVAPTSSPERLGKIARQASGFIYAVSLTGVTGAREVLPDYLKDFIKTVKTKTSLPVAVGFGISRPEQAREIVEFADGAIVGSAIINLMEKSSPQKLLTDVGDYGAELLAAIK